jgi:hypothetical protein
MQYGINLGSPCESPIEEELVRVLEKYVSEEALVTNQVEIPTPHGTFRLDFLVEVAGVKIGLEADGKEFHSYAHDMFRDSVILGYSDVHAIYHLRGKEIVFHIEDALFTLSAVEARLFSKRGLINLGTLSSLSRSSGQIRVESELIFGKEQRPDTNVVSILHVSKTAKNPIWRRLSDFAKLHPGLCVDELIALGDAQGLDWYRD